MLIQMQSRTIALIVVIIMAIVVLFSLIMTQWLNSGKAQVVTSTSVDAVVISLVAIALILMLIVYIMYALCEYLQKPLSNFNIA